MTTWGFIGTGNMASAIVRGAVASGFLEGEDVVLFNPTAAKAEAIADDIGAQVVESAAAVVAASDVVVLGFKPGTFPEVLPTLAADLIARGTLVISIAAGLTLNRLVELLDDGRGSDVAVVRAMPNVNALVGAGMTAVTANENVSEEDRALVLGLFGAVGQAVELEEKHFSAFTAIAGSSPAFAFLFIDSLARGALEAGLPKAIATQIAAQAVAGSARTVLATGTHPWTLIDQVCSPGGTTIAGLLALEENAFISTVVDAVRATVARDKELGSGS